MPSRNHRLLYAAIALFFLLAWTQPARTQQRPLITEDVDIIPPGSVRIEAGIDFLQGSKFPASGLTGDLTRVGVLGISIGFAPNVEFQIEGVTQNFLSINSRGASAIPLSLAPGANSANDTGDFILWTKFKLRSETKRGPSFGFRVGVGLPNSNQSRGIGLNQTNAYGSILVGKKFGRNGRFNTFGNLGGALSPVVVGVALQRWQSWNAPLWSPLGTESQSEARLGMQIRASGLRFDFAGIKGLTRFTHDSGFTVGVTYDTPSIFAPAK